MLESLFLKLQALQTFRPLIKRDSNKDAFLWILRKFYEYHFLRGTSGNCFCMLYRQLNRACIFLWQCALVHSQKVFKIYYFILTVVYRSICCKNIEQKLFSKILTVCRCTLSDYHKRNKKLFLHLCTI